MASPKIKTIQECHIAMQKIDDLMTSDELSPNEVNVLRTLSVAVEVFENKNFPIRNPTSREEADFHVDQNAKPLG